MFFNIIVLILKYNRIIAIENNRRNFEKETLYNL
jgi:hypothetical protein